MQTAAVRHRPESEDCYLVTTETMKLRLHTGRDVKAVYVHYCDVHEPLTNLKKQAMDLAGHGQVNDYWEATVTLPLHRAQYVFEIHGEDGEEWFYGDRGFRKNEKESYEDPNNYFKLPYFHAVDMTKSPDWVKETVWYQIFPERFANGDKSNDPEGVKDWNPSDHPGREDYYGGDLQGVLDHLDYLQDLGINGLYFCPIFKASSNHKYDTIDYLEIDPDFGDKQLFVRLVNEAHARGMKVMLDAVFNHMGDSSMQWQDVVKNGPNSRFANWFHINRFPVEPYDPADPSYETFAFEKHMPKLNTANPEVVDYLLTIATYWVKEFDIDAWRLDVADEVDHQFWKKFKAAVTAIKPDFYVLGESWHSSQSWLNGDEFSGTMNYPFTGQIADHFLKGTQDAKTMTELLTDQLFLYREQSNSAMLNVLDSHDTARIKTVAGEDEDKALQALAFTFMQTGSPCIYYGTEMGMSGDNDPDCRKPMDWSQAGSPVWQAVQAIIAFRRQHWESLSKGQTWLEVEENGLIHVKRTGKETIEGWFNTTGQAVSLSAEATLSRGYEAGQLASKGYVLSVK